MCTCVVGVLSDPFPFAHTSHSRLAVHDQVAAWDHLSSHVRSRAVVQHVRQNLRLQAALQHATSLGTAARTEHATSSHTTARTEHAASSLTTARTEVPHAVRDARTTERKETDARPMAGKDSDTAGAVADVASGERTPLWRARDDAERTPLWRARDDAERTQLWRARDDARARAHSLRSDARAVAVVTDGLLTELAA